MKSDEYRITKRQKDIFSFLVLKIKAFASFSDNNVNFKN